MDMTSSINSLIATEHVADLHRLAEQRRPIAGTSQPSVARAARPPAISLRPADAEDAHVVEHLAALDEAPVPEGAVLLALVDGEAVAALSLGDGRVVANPFMRTEAAVELLRLRREHVFGKRSRRRWPVIPRLRFA
jgi:hypothetical protein